MNLKNISICTFKLAMLILQIQIQAFQLPKQLSKKITDNAIKNAALAVLSGTSGWSLLNGYKNQKDIEKLQQDSARHLNTSDMIQRHSGIKLAALEKTIWTTREQMETPMQKQNAIGTANFPAVSFNQQGQLQSGIVLTMKSLASRPGDGNINCPITSHLDTFKTIQTAYDFIKTNACALNIDQKDIHEQSVMTYINLNTPCSPYTGLSSGAAITTALISTYTNRSIRQDCAMTGQMAEDGTIGHIGGLEFKIPAVRAAGIKNLIVPEANKSDVQKLAPEIIQGVTIIYVNHINEILEHVLCKPLNDSTAQKDNLDHEHRQIATTMPSTMIRSALS